MFSSGIGIMSPASGGSFGSAIDPYKMKEIKHYVANELYKCQKKTNEAFKELENLQKLKEGNN